MKRSFLKKAFGAIALLILLFVFLAFWLTGTESGMHAAYRYIITYLPGEVSVKKLEGSLIGSITINGLIYKQDGTEISAKQIKLDWSPSSLLTNNLEINRLHIQSLLIRVSPSKNNNIETAALPELRFPMRITLKNITIDDVDLYQTGNHYRIKTIKLIASTQLDKVLIESLNLAADSYGMNLSGEFYPIKDYRHKLDIDWYAILPTKIALDGLGSIAGDISETNIQQRINGPVKLTLNADVRDLFKELNWQVEANIININPGEVWPEWPGQLKGKLSSRGKIKNGQLLSEPNDIRLTGKLRDYPVSLRSQLAILNNGIDIHTFDLRSGGARVNAQGRIASTLNLAWDINAKNLAELYPQAKGQFHAKGRFRGPLTTPQIDATLNGKTMRLADFEIGSLNGDIGVDLFRWQQIKINVAALSLKLNDNEIQSLQIDSDTQNLKIQAITNIASAQIEAKGKADQQGWHGHIEKFDIQSSRLANWSLPSPATLKIYKKALILESLCLQSKESRFCAALQQENATWKTSLEMSKLPLSLFNSWLATDLKVEGIADATAELYFRTPDQLSGKTDILLSRGSVSYPLLEGGHGKWEYNSGTVNIKLDNQGLNASSNITVTRGGHLIAQLKLPGVKLLAIDAKQSLQASAKVNLHDLGLIEALVPDIQDLKGKAELSFSATGTLGQPRLRGHANLLNGTFRIPRLGLTVKQLVLNSQSDGLDKANFQLNAHSGDGEISVKGKTILNKLQGWTTSIDINGDNFEVSNIQVARVSISPNLHIEAQKNNITINGKVHIPYAKLQPKDITTAVRVSQDAVILGSDQPVDEKWSIVTKIQVSLGERVNFFGYGFEGRFDGSLLLEDTPGNPTKATGEINIPEGRYRAYGQRLDVEYGRLLYTEGPITNPGLDLRAIRNLGNVIAGLKVRGSLNQPQVEIFSNPVMGQTDALSYLILGRPIESASNDDGALMAKAALALGLSGGDSMVRLLGDRFGLDEMRIESSESGDQASLVIGRYLSPKLYVGYGIGLIESFNTFNVRYDISDKWKLKGESGEHHGADLLYTIER